VPAADQARFRAWTDRILAISGDGSSVAQAHAELAGYLRALVDQRRAQPEDDLLSQLVAVAEDGDRLTEEELVTFGVTVLVAGHETTANLIANAVLALLRHPDQLDLLRSRPELVDGCVEETLRYDAPVQLTTRAARGPLPVGPVQMPDGGLVLLLLAAAGRDPAVYPDPDRFDITRRGAGHLAFAAGPHFCLGAGLARLEAAVALAAFAQRVRAPRLVDAAVRYKANINLRGPAALPVGFASVTAAT
jgi:cytochrome P450